MAAVHRQRHEERQQGHVAQTSAVAHHQDHRREDPSGPTRHRRVGPTGVVDDGARQLEDGPPERRTQGAEPEHPASA